MMVNRDPFYYIIPCFVLLVAPHHKFLFVSLFFGTRNFVLTNKKIEYLILCSTEELDLWNVIKMMRTLKILMKMFIEHPKLKPFIHFQCNTLNVNEVAPVITAVVCMLTEF